MLSSLVSGLRSRYRRQMQLQTQQMEPHVRTQLVEYVQDNMIIEDDEDNDDDDGNGGNDKGGTNKSNDGDHANANNNTDSHHFLDIDIIQEELDVAHDNITKLKSKEEFILTRLTKYKQLPQEKLTQGQKDQLVDIENIHTNMVSQITNFTKRIQQLEQQQSLIMMQKEECDDFLQIAHDIEVQRNIQREREREGQFLQDEHLEQHPSTAPSSSEIIIMDGAVIDDKDEAEDNNQDEGDVELGKVVVVAEEEKEEVAFAVGGDQDGRNEPTAVTTTKEDEGIASNDDDSHTDKNSTTTAAVAAATTTDGDAAAAIIDGEGDDYVDIEVNDYNDDDGGANAQVEKQDG